MTSVAVLIPVLSRPARVEPLLESLAASVETIDLRPFFLASPGDEAELDALRSSDADFAIVTWPPGRGDWARKINAGYRLTDEEWILLGADDLAFESGWADRALERAAATGARVVGTSDGPCGNREVRSGVFSPHPLVAASYVADGLAVVDAPGHVVCETYDHNWPDRELAETAKARDEWAFARDAIVTHLHPHWFPEVASDATYERGRERFAEDAALFRRRASLWTGLYNLAG